MVRAIAVVLFILLLGAIGASARLQLLPFRLDLDIGIRMFSFGAFGRHLEDRAASPSSPAGDPSDARNSKVAVAEPGKLDPAAENKSPPAATVAGTPENGSTAITIDVRRLSRDGGTSVIAGRAPPNSQVAVLDGATEIGSATANDNGDWSVAVDHKFATSDPQISAKLAEAKSNAPDAAVQSNASPPPPSVRLMQEFEAVVANAREENKEKAVRESGGSVEAAKEGSRPSEKATVSSGTAPVPTVSSTPVLMTFVYDEDELTPQGRKAMDLLLEYLKLKKFKAVTLTGHADERGTAEYNIELSRKRLDAIYRQLRAGGFQGELTLLPKGASEPYAGVDRHQYPHEELMQLDRRVELRTAE